MIFESISKATKSLMFKEPYYGLLLMALNKEVSEKIPTACVSRNQINPQLTINPKYWNTLNDNVRIGLVKHELLHIAFFHLTMMDSFPDKSLFNIAADLEINQYIAAEQCGEGWLYLKNYPEFNFPEKAGTKVYYDMLSKVNQQRKAQGKGQHQPSPQGQSQPGQGQGQPQPGGQQGQPQPGNGKGQPQQNQPKKPGQGGKTDPTDSQIWDYYDKQMRGESTICSHELWKEFFENLPDAEKKLIEKQINHQLKEIAEGMKDRGFVPAELRQHVDSLFEVEPPVVNWKAYLRRFGGASEKIYTKKTRRKLNKRFVENPALKIKTKKTILVGRDTSGSVSEEDHKEFFNELHHIHKTGVKIFVADCDADVADVFEYDGKAPDHRSGGGGTDFDPVIEYYNKHYKKYNALIYLTDGFCSPPSTKPRTTMLWVITSRGTIPAGLPGKAVQINHG